MFNNRRSGTRGGVMNKANHFIPQFYPARTQGSGVRFLRSGSIQALIPRANVAATADQALALAFSAALSGACGIRGFGLRSTLR